MDEKLKKAIAGQIELVKRAQIVDMHYSVIGKLLEIEDDAITEELREAAEKAAIPVAEGESETELLVIRIVR